MSNIRHVLINLKNTDSIEKFHLTFGNAERQKPLELSLSILLGSKVDLSFIDDAILLIESETCELRLDVSKSDLLKLKKE